MAIPTSPQGKRDSSSKAAKSRHRSIKGLTADEEDRLSLLDKSIEELRVTMTKSMNGEKKGTENSVSNGVALEGSPEESEEEVPIPESLQALMEAEKLKEKNLKPKETPVKESPATEAANGKVTPPFDPTPQSKPATPSQSPSKPVPSPPPSAPPSRRHSSKTIEDKENLWMELLRRKDEQLTLVLKREKVAVERMRSRVRDLEAKLNGPIDASDREDWAMNMKREQDEKLRDLQDAQTRLINEFKNVKDPVTGGDPTLEMQMFVASNATEDKRGDADTAPTGEVTLVFTDVQSSTYLWDQATAEMMSSLQMHNALMRELIAKNDGYEVKTEGDAFMVAFNEPENAVRWALDVQVKLLEEPWPGKILAMDDASTLVTPAGVKLWNGLRVRVGIHTGEPSCIPDILTGRMDYFGPMVNTGARVAGCARGGEIVCSAEVFNRTKHLKNQYKMGIIPLGEKKFKGVTQAVDCHRLVPDALQNRIFVEPKPAAPAKLGDSTKTEKGVSTTFLQWVVREEQKRDESPPEGVLSLVFTDVQSSTHLWDTMEKEMWTALNKHNQLMRRLIAHHNGYEVKTEGDAFMVAFKKPADAIGFVAEAQIRLLTVEWPVKLLLNSAACEEKDPQGNVVWNGLRVRCGVHVGRPESARDPVTKRMDYFGPMVNLAARVGGCANGGEIVISKPVYDEVHRSGLLQKLQLDITSLGDKQFKGVTASVGCYRIMPRSLAGRKFPPSPPPPSAAIAAITATRVQETPPVGAAMDPNCVAIPKEDLQAMHEAWLEFAEIMDKLSDGKARHYKEEKERKEVLQGRRMSQKSTESPKPHKKPPIKDRRHSLYQGRRKSVVMASPAITVDVKEKREVDDEDCRAMTKDFENLSAFMNSQPEQQVKKIFCQERDVKYVVAFGSTVEVTTVRRRPRQSSKEKIDLESPKGAAKQSPGSTPSVDDTPQSAVSSTPAGQSTPMADPVPLAARPPLYNMNGASPRNRRESGPDDLPLPARDISPAREVPMRQAPSTSESWGTHKYTKRDSRGEIDPKYVMDGVHSPRPPGDQNIADIINKRSGSAATRRAKSLPHRARASSGQARTHISQLLPSI